MLKEYTIRKKIAKHGEHSIIVIPKLFREELKPKTIVEVTKLKITEEECMRELVDLLTIL